MDDPKNGDHEIKIDQGDNKVVPYAPSDDAPGQHELPNSPVLRRPIILGDFTLASPTTQTTVGAAGGASALPATPTGYFVVQIGDTSYVVPFYAIS